MSLDKVKYCSNKALALTHNTNIPSQKQWLIHNNELVAVHVFVEITIVILSHQMGLHSPVHRVCAAEHGQCDQQHSSSGEPGLPCQSPDSAHQRHAGRYGHPRDD